MSQGWPDQGTDAPRGTTAAATAAPTLPVPRRSGKGFIMSFGDHRTCSAAGCTTQLSRYNPAHVCANHGRRQHGNS